MDIILVSNVKKNWKGGASSVYLHLAQELQKLNVQNHLFHLENYSDPDLPSALQKLSAAFSLKSKILSRAKKTDVVEVGGNIGWCLFKALRSAKLPQRPLLVTRLHGLEFKDEQAAITEEIAHLIKLPTKYKLFSRHWINWQEFKTLELADLVICHTSREADALVTAGLKPESKIRVFPLGVDSDFIGHRRHRPQSNKLLWWGSWIERKGISTLPRAFELAVRELPHLSLTIGGTNTAPQEVLSYFASQLRPRITVLPLVSKTQYQKILTEHDLFLFPSLSEGFGLALLEAMATGMPCITTLTGMYDWLEHGDNCYIVPMSAPTALAKAIKRLHENVEFRKIIGDRATVTAQNLSWQNFGENTLAVYQEYLAKIRTSTELSDKDSPISELGEVS
jgi:glycosyltransferase involved in cell wall biosynthesis